MFLLIGLEVKLDDIVEAWRSVAVAFAIVTVVRGCLVFLTSTALSRTAERTPWRWSLLLTWGGLRGALSMVLARALPAQFPQRHLVVSTTFGVVILSIVVNGPTTEPLLRWLGLARVSQRNSEG